MWNDYKNNKCGEPHSKNKQRALTLFYIIMKMKKCISFILLSGLLTGCTEIDNQTPDHTAYPLQIESVQLERIKTRNTTPLTAEGASIGVATLASGTIAQQNQYTYTSNAWVCAGSTPFIVPAETTICAYYPYNSNISDKTAIPLTSGLYRAADDLSYAYTSTVANTTNSTTYAEFVLRHAYARLTFNFSASSTYGGSKSISNITITSPDINSSAILDITSPTGIYTNTPGEVSVNPAISDFTVTPTCSILMLPTHTLSSSVNVYIQLGDKIRLLSIPASLFSDILTAGVNYQFSVNVSATELSISSVQTTDWITSAPESQNIVCNPEANCYFAYPGGNAIYIPVSRANTAAIANGKTPPLQLGVTTFTAGILWYDFSNVQSVKADVANGLIAVMPGGYTGNVVIYAKVGSTIIWTWHIWISNYNPDIPGSTTYTANGFTWMDRCLGAKAFAGTTYLYSGGTMYQWGRKDPFTGSDGSTGEAKAKPMIAYPVPSAIGGTTVTDIANDNYTKAFNIGNYPVTPANALSYSITNPPLFFFNWAGSTATTAAAPNAAGGMYSWNSPSGKKTIYDPCPPGWRVPAYIRGITSPWSTWNNVTSFTPSNSAYTIWSNNIRYPATGYRMYNTGAFADVGSGGYYWSATPSNTNAYALYFDASSVNPSAEYTRDYALPVYCVKE